MSDCPHCENPPEDNRNVPSKLTKERSGCPSDLATNTELHLQAQTRLLNAQARKIELECTDIDKLISDASTASTASCDCKSKIVEAMERSCKDPESFLKNKANPYLESHFSGKRSMINLVKGLEL